MNTTKVVVLVVTAAALTACGPEVKDTSPPEGNIIACRATIQKQVDDAQAQGMSAFSPRATPTPAQCSGLSEAQVGNISTDVLLSEIDVALTETPTHG